MEVDVIELAHCLNLLYYRYYCRRFPRPASDVDGCVHSMLSASDLTINPLPPHCAASMFDGTYHCIPLDGSVMGIILTAVPVHGQRTAIRLSLMGLPARRSLYT